MNQLQESLDSLKGRKLPEKTFFGEYETFARPREWQQGENRYLHIPTEPSGAKHIPDRLPQYVRFISTLTSVSGLLAELSEALKGKDQ